MECRVIIKTLMANKCRKHKNISISHIESKGRVIWHFHNKGMYTVHLAYKQLQTRESQLRQQVESSAGAGQEEKKCGG